MNSRASIDNSAPSVFEHPQVRAAGLQLVPIEELHFELLKEMDRPDIGMRSPVNRVRIEKDWISDMKDRGCFDLWTDEERSEIIYAFMLPVSQVIAILDQGRAFFRAEAIRCVEQQLNEILLGELSEAVTCAFADWLEVFKKNGGITS